MRFRRTIQVALTTVLLVVGISATPALGGVGRDSAGSLPVGQASSFTGPPYEAYLHVKHEPNILVVIDSVSRILATMFPAPPAPPPQKAVSAPVRPPAAILVPVAPQTPGAPTPISSERCVNRGRPDIGTMIEATFGPAGPWAESVAVRESGCTPTALNSGGCRGLFQFCGHEDIFVAICGSVARWVDPACSIPAAYHLYLGSGIGPWAL